MAKRASLAVFTAAAFVMGLSGPGDVCLADEAGGTMEGFPVPPAQAQAWTPPPTALPPVVISAITALFKDGLADPRGCEYREVGASFFRQPRKMHGWVLPEQGKQRFAIGWDGGIYPVTAANNSADLKGDFLAGAENLFGGFPERWISESGGLSPVTFQAIKAALLLRLGEGKMAEAFWTQTYRGTRDGGNFDPYAVMAGQWLGPWYRRAFFAHHRSDDAQAIAICRFLLPLQRKVEETVAARSLPKAFPGALYIEELRELPALAADQERRAQERPRPAALAFDFPEGSPERITVLIRDLQEISVEQYTNPGETNVLTDAGVQALIREGGPAVEPLIECLAHDDRLTRARYTRHMWAHGPIIPVYEAAYVALTGILKTADAIPIPDGKDPFSLSQADRAALANQFAVYWRKNKKPA